MAVQTEWLEKDYYEVLGVPEGATEKDIQRAYRGLARRYHPDANPGDPGAEDRFKEVSAAYDVLGDADRRKEYDELRRLGPMAAGAPGGFGADGGGFSGFSGFGGGSGGFRVEDLGDLTDLGDLFGELLGGGQSWVERCGMAGAAGQEAWRASRPSPAPASRSDHELGPFQAGRAGDRAGRRRRGSPLHAASTASIVSNSCWLCSLLDMAVSRRLGLPAGCERARRIRSPSRSAPGGPALVLSDRPERAVTDATFALGSE